MGARLLYSAVGAMLLSAGACATDPVVTPTAPLSGADSTPVETPEALEGSDTAGAAFLSFTAPAIGGGQVDAAQYQGRPTLLWFWSPW